MRLAAPGPAVHPEPERGLTFGAYADLSTGTDVSDRDVRHVGGMNAVDPPRRASFGLSVLVALGWFVIAIAAVLAGRSGVPAAPTRDCSLVFSCLTPFEEAELFLMFTGVPIVLGVLVVTAVITALLGRRVSSPVLIGGLSALCSLLVAAGIVAVWHGGR